MEVSWNGGCPQSSIFNGIFHYKPSILGTSIYGNVQITMTSVQRLWNDGGRFGSDPWRWFEGLFTGNISWFHQWPFHNKLPYTRPSFYDSGSPIDFMKFHAKTSICTVFQDVFLGFFSPYDWTRGRLWTGSSPGNVITRSKLWRQANRMFMMLRWGAVIGDFRDYICHLLC